MFQKALDLTTTSINDIFCIFYYYSKDSQQQNDIQEFAKS